MSSDTQVQELPPLVSKDYQALEQLEERWLNHEENNRGDAGSMIAQKVRQAAWQVVASAALCHQTPASHDERSGVAEIHEQLFGVYHRRIFSPGLKSYKLERPPVSQ